MKKGVYIFPTDLDMKSRDSYPGSLSQEPGLESDTKIGNTTDNCGEI
jgi:hypothetical protein